MRVVRFALYGSTHETAEELLQHWRATGAALEVTMEWSAHLPDGKKLRGEMLRARMVVSGLFTEEVKT